jgi:hypothetical protein
MLPADEEFSMIDQHFPVYCQDDGTIDYDRYRREAGDLRRVARTYYLGRLFSAVWQKFVVRGNPAPETCG